MRVFLVNKKNAVLVPIEFCIWRSLVTELGGWRFPPSPRDEVVLMAGTMFDI